MKKTKFIHFYGNAGFPNTTYHKFKEFPACFSAKDQDRLIKMMSRKLCTENAIKHLHLVDHFNGDQDAYLAQALETADFQEVPYLSADCVRVAVG